MAERRMFAKTIIDSDAFLDMPLSTQSLYFHLSMRGDDEGFINNPKKIQKMIGASEDDLKLLIAKNFIIPFESGVVVIKHWKIHNYIRGDRLVETKYQDEKQMLTVKENGAYTIAQDAKGLPEISSADRRKIAYENSTLPYSFTYKIRRAFEGKKCPLCGRKMTSSCKTLMPTVQHNIPISKGGEHELENISVICESCNTSYRDKETESLNNMEVIETWDKIRYLESHNIKWFDDLSVLETVDVSQMSGRCQADVSIGKDSIGKNRIDKNIKHKHGSYNNVLLTDEEYEKLKEEFPTDYEERIERVSSYCASTGKSYKNYLATIRNWAKKDAPKEETKKERYVMDI